MPNDKWNIQEPLQGHKLFKKGKSLDETQNKPIVEISKEPLAFNENGMYIPRSKRHGRK